MTTKELTPATKVKKPRASRVKKLVGELNLELLDLLDQPSSTAAPIGLTVWKPALIEMVIDPACSLGETLTYRVVEDDREFLTIPVTNGCREISKRAIELTYKLQGLQVQFV